MLTDPIRAAPDPDLVRRAAHQVLMRREFQRAPQSPIDRLRRWVFAQIAKTVASALSGRATVLGIILLIVIAGTLVIVAFRLARSTQRDPSAPGVAVRGGRRAPSDWLAEAGACERRGDWRGALRARYRALVAELASRRIVEEVPGRTTGEYRTAVARAVPGCAEPFGGATDLFEAAIYGDRPSGPSESAEIAALADRVLALAR